MHTKPLVYNDETTLFLDRDGVINRRIVGGYVTEVPEFEFLEGVLEAMMILSARFKTIVIVTNQQGIGKGIMTEDDLNWIHAHMLELVTSAGGRVDGIYFCPKLATEHPECRKPATGMAKQAKKDFPWIEFSNSIMVGDSESDMEFGSRLGMHCAFIGNHQRHLSFDSLIHFARSITSE